MRRILASTVTLLILAAFSGRAAQLPGQAASGQRSTAAGGVIRGRITAADTGRPVRGARIQVTAAELPTPRAVVTDVNGRFEIGGLRDGRYTVTAAAPGFLTLSYGQSRPFEKGKLVALSTEQNQQDISIVLARGGAIAGTVLNEAGKPLISAFVTVSRPQFVRGVQQLVVVDNATTNDLGEFRISGLNGGNYFVSARKSIGLAPTPDTESGYGRTFFPGSREVSGAQRVPVRAGQTFQVSFALQAAGTGAITGKLLTNDNRPLPSIATVRAQRGDGLDETSVVVPGGTATFNVLGLSPGRYQLNFIVPVLRGGSNENLVPRIGLSEVVLSGERLTSVDLVVNPMAKVTGRVVVDSATNANLPFTSIKLVTKSAEPAATWWSDANLTPEADSSFELYAPPGRMLIRPTLPKGWALRSVHVKGVDATDSGIEIRGNQNMDDVEVEITDRICSVVGSVREANGDRVEDFTVLVFPQDRRRWIGDDRVVAIARPDQNGLFSVEGLPEGNYFAAALDYLDPAEAHNPALFESLERGAKTVTLREGTTVNLDLTVAQQ
jgi:hypothetical protein